LRKRLRDRLEYVAAADETVGVYNSFDIIGDVAITRLPENSTVDAQLIAQAIMSRHGGVKAVFAQASAVAGDFRLRKLTCLSGENKTCTTHKEHGCAFAVNLETCYFSPRLSGERLRIAQLIRPYETVVNMFAGVGCFSIIIAKHVPSAKIYSIDVNPEALQFMEENIRLNRVYGKVIPLFGDAKAVIENTLKNCADRVLMPLPEKALEYLPCAVSALKPEGGWIHVHLFEHAQKRTDAISAVKTKISQALDSLGVNFEVPFVRIVRSTGPNWFQLVADMHMRN
jgi:tRNA (guanine37-N1)-methyltransferase